MWLHFGAVLVRFYACLQTTAAGSSLQRGSGHAKEKKRREGPPAFTK